MDPEMEKVIREIRVKRLNTLKEAIKSIQAQPIPNDTLAMEFCDEYEEIAGKLGPISRDR